jgi:hypothetical protein
MHSRIEQAVLAAMAALAMAACAPGYGPAGVEFAVRAPPREIVEVRTGSPGRDYVWVPGHYVWERGDYVWVRGEWRVPPESRYRRWQPGHWQRARNGWYWVEGRWR